MELINIKDINKFLLIIIFSLSIRSVFADAWTQKEGDLLLINAISLSEFNQTNYITGGITDNKVGGIQLNSYFEYGFLNNLTIGGKISYTSLFQDANGSIGGKIKYTSNSFDGVEIFGRLKIFSYKNFIMSFVTGFKTKGYYKEDYHLREFGIPSVEQEQKIEIGYSFDNEEHLQIYNAQRVFMTASLAYRKFYSFADQIRFEFILGVPINQTFLILSRFQKINYLFKEDPYYGISMPSVFAFNAGFTSLVKAYVSLVTKIDDSNFIEIGYTNTIADKNLNSDLKNINFHSISISLWTYFSA